jgi:hypothetical protein
MFNRSYQRAARRTPLQGEQIDIYFPRRGRTSRFRKLERAGQMRLNLVRPAANSEPANSEHKKIVLAEPDTIEEAVDYLFPIRPMTEDELAAEFDRLFPTH